jgi:hypothetical protein
MTQNLFLFYIKQKLEKFKVQIIHSFYQFSGMGLEDSLFSWGRSSWGMEYNA